MCLLWQVDFFDALSLPLYLSVSTHFVVFLLVLPPRQGGEEAMMAGPPGGPRAATTVFPPTTAVNPPATREGAADTPLREEMDFLVEENNAQRGKAMARVGPGARTDGSNVVVGNSGGEPAAAGGGSLGAEDGGAEEVLVGDNRGMGNGERVRRTKSGGSGGGFFSLW